MKILKNILKDEGNEKNTEIGIGVTSMCPYVTDSGNTKYVGYVREGV